LMLMRRSERDGGAGGDAGVVADVSISTAMAARVPTSRSA
jgi:hypothetical protein